jgi:predicted patatin/cPLA2 family phospholipase
MRLRGILERSDLPVAGQDRHPIVNLMLERAGEGSRRGARRDGAVIALAIEGGGLGGAVSAGMCVFLEQAGLIDAVDVIYGTSSGALNGSFTASGQAALGSTNYLDTANRRFANPMRIAFGRAAIDFDLLFDGLIRNRKPYSESGLASGPPFRALGVDLDKNELSVLSDFADVEELMAAVRVSCALPLLSGEPPIFRGRAMADGGLVESMPYAAALAGGATHVLVLRSRPVAYRKKRYPRAVIAFARRSSHPSIPKLLEARPARYNEEADYLEGIGQSNPSLLQINPPPHTPKVSQLERSAEVIRAGMVDGARAAATAFGIDAIDLYWQPQVYSASPQ